MNIVPQDLPANIAKEFSINEKGQGFVSRRGIARLSGVHEKSIRTLLKSIESSAEQKLSKPLKTFAGQAFEGAGQLPDILATSIIQHYAFSGKDVAQSTLMAIGTIGLRTVIQKSLDWEAPRKLTDKEIVKLMCLPVPTTWEPRFVDEYYQQLSRLTGLAPIGNSRPRLWGKITKEFVYDYLPTGVYEEVKAWQLANSSHTKLHQYLSDDGLRVLGEQLKRVITLMQAASHLNEVKTLLEQSSKQSYQLSLLAS